MLTIRNEQIRQLAQARRAAFEGRVIARLQKTYSDDAPELMTTELLAPRVRAIIGRAQEQGIDEEDDVMAFVEIAFEVGDEFDTYPENEWAIQILDDSMLSPHEKTVEMQFLLEELAEHDADGRPHARQFTDT